MKLEEYYGEHIANYPEYLTQEQVCEMCKLSKKTVYKLERSGKLPYTVEVNHLIHTHKIWIMDVLKYLYEKECRHEPDSKYIKAMRLYYEKQFSKYPDVLSSKEVEVMTGFSQSGIANWLLKGQLKSFKYKTNYSN